MALRSHLDDLRVVDIEHAETEERGPGRTCARCRAQRDVVVPWSATFCDRAGDTFAVALCDPCWSQTRTRLERDVFRDAWSHADDVEPR